jgi:hypothetical protein
MRNDVYRYDVTKLSRFAAADNESNYFVIIIGNQSPTFSRSHIELKLKPGISQLSAERRSVNFIKVSKV